MLWIHGRNLPPPQTELRTQIVLLDIFNIELLNNNLGVNLGVNIVRLQIIYLLGYNNGWVLPPYFTAGGVWGWAGRPLAPQGPL